MPYTAVPDQRIPYDNDGSVVGYNGGGGYSGGVTLYLSGADRIELNDQNSASLGLSPFNNYGYPALWIFFPERREITAAYIAVRKGNGHEWSSQGSNDSVNGVDGTWETPSYPGGLPDYNTNQFDDWRSKIMPISFTGGKKIWRMAWGSWSWISTVSTVIYSVHLYGEKVAGQTPDDVIYIDQDTTPGLEYASVEDFGDQPLGTTVVRQFRLKNVSATKTANSINIQCNDTDFTISTDGTTWVVTINITSLAPSAQSATMYIRCTTPAPGTPLGPRFARIVTTVGSYT